MPASTRPRSAGVSRLCTSENRGRLTSYFVVGGNLGYAIGPVLAGVLVWWLGLPGLLLLVFPAVIMALPSGTCSREASPGLQAPANTGPSPGRQHTLKNALCDPDGRFDPQGLGSLCRDHVPADVSRQPGVHSCHGNRDRDPDAPCRGRGAGLRRPDIRPVREKGVHGLRARGSDPARFTSSSSAPGSLRSSPFSSSDLRSGRHLRLPSPCPTNSCRRISGSPPG